MLHDIAALEAAHAASAAKDARIRRLKKLQAQLERLPDPVIDDVYFHECSAGLRIDPSSVNAAHIAVYGNHGALSAHQVGDKVVLGS